MKTIIKMKKITTSASLICSLMVLFTTTVFATTSIEIDSVTLSNSNINVIGKNFDEAKDIIIEKGYLYIIEN